jgi:MFS-type transporter involved in bile tolerance (Atg22 family)
MTTNIGTIDRILRILVGLALVAVAFGLFGPAYQTAWGWIGLIPIATALISWCPLYSVFGVKTSKNMSTLSA